MRSQIPSGAEELLKKYPWQTALIAVCVFFLITFSFSLGTPVKKYVIVSASKKETKRKKSVYQSGKNSKVLVENKGCRTRSQEHYGDLLR